MNLTSTLLALALLTGIVPFASGASGSRVPKIALPKGFCAELTEPGLELTPQISSLIVQSLADSGPGVDMEQFGFRKLRFYKAKMVHGSKYVYLVFSIRGFSDVYMVYLGDLKDSRIVARATYGSLHYPCPAPPRGSSGG